MRILITGIAGFIGSHIADLCLQNGHTVVGIDNLATGNESNIPKGVDFIEGSVTWNQTWSYLKSHNFDCICHQAAQASLRSSIDDPLTDAEVNIFGTIRVIQAAMSRQAHLVFASTSAVYTNDGQAIPFSEDSHINPNLPYGISKMAAEQYIRHSGLSYTILRYGNVYGPRQVKVGENQLIPHCLGYLLRGEPFVINGDGEQVRDFVYVKDIARANLMAMEKRPQGTFNCGTGNMKSVNTVCYLLAEMAFRDGKQENMNWQEGQSIFNHGPAKPGEMRASGLNSQKAFDTFGWRAETSLIDGLRMTYEWARNNIYG